MLGLHFTPACVLLLVCSLHFTHSLHFTPGPQSAVCVLHWPAKTSQVPVQRRGSGEKCVYFATCLPSRGQPQQASYPGQFAPSEFVQVQLCMFSRLHQRRTVKQKLIDNQTVSHTENFKHTHLVTCISAPKCEPLVVIILSYQLRSISLLKVVAAKRVYCASFPVILNDSLPWFVKLTWPIYLVNILSRVLFTNRLLLSKRDNSFHYCELLPS